MRIIPIESVDQNNGSSEDQKASTVLALYNTEWKDYLVQKNYDKDINNMCTNCQKEQMIKYGHIAIKCNGPKLLEYHIPDDALCMLNENEISSIREGIDPYYWADKNIDIFSPPEKRIFSERWYQKFMISCSSKRKVVRCGRRVGKTFFVAVDIANRIINNSNYQILAITPFQSQAKELSDTVRKILRSINPKYGEWKDIVRRSVTSPYQEIMLTNGSTFKAFTAGGQDAASIRGQGAHWVIVDEADYLSKAAIDSIAAILLDKPDTEFTCTSSPKGENILFKLSQSKDYKEFHYPSFVVPHYDDEIDEEFRKTMSVIGYLREVQAEFGTDEDAVFQIEFVNRAQSNVPTYTVRDVLLNRDKFIVSLGCDWNADKIGTRISIIAYAKETREIFVVEMVTVRREGWTQVDAIDTIVELNRKYVPDYIYVDEGFGESNVQHLKLRAIDNYGKLPYNHPDLRLDQVKAINFASTLELVDVVTNDVRKKYFKNFIVEVTKRALEGNILYLGNKEAEDLVFQMKNYMIKSRTANGREIYEAKIKEIGDHDLDAFMLALAGIHLNNDQMLDLKVVSEMTIVPIEKQEIKNYNQVSEVIQKRGEYDGGLNTRRAMAPGNRTSGLSGEGSRWTRGSPFSRYMRNTSRSFRK